MRREIRTPWGACGRNGEEMRLRAANNGGEEIKMEKVGPPFGHPFEASGRQWVSISVLYIRKQLTN
jgi:hypothetical protein